MNVLTDSVIVRSDISTPSSAAGFSFTKPKLTAAALAVLFLCAVGFSASTLLNRFKSQFAELQQIGEVIQRESGYTILGVESVAAQVNGKPVVTTLLARVSLTKDIAEQDEERKAAVGKVFAALRRQSISSTADNLMVIVQYKKFVGLLPVTERRGEREAGGPSGSAGH